MTNRLNQETSPYLRQHAGNPVDWWSWSDAAFENARKTGRPVLLSIGYAACHWCHVMAHESFEDAGIAALMNEHFVNIKVDREERPDVDHIYQTALQVLGQQGGWPLTMFLTADRQPFWGGTYFPKLPAYGRPGFGDILHQIARIYKEEPEKVGKNCAEITSALQKISAGPPTEAFPPGALEDAAKTLFGAGDPENGGFGQAPKFPATSAVELIWRAALRTDNAACSRHFLRTMERMCHGGIYDHLGGGFARYATDARWLVPHFEKMLYDNALILELLAQAYAATGRDLFKRRAANTVAWLEREMLLEEGAFAASLDADSAGGEGTYYVWTKDEIDRLLGAESVAFARQYDVTASGNFEGRNILNQLLSQPDAQAEADLAGARGILLAARAKRERPARDDKLLADWNGLAVRALVRAATVFDRADWLALAIGAYDALLDALLSTDGLLHSLCRGKPGPPAMLDDFAAIIGASIALFEATGRKIYLEKAQSWLQRLNLGFLDGERGGFFSTEEGATDLIVRDRPLHDAATPSGNGMMAENLLRLALLTGNVALRDRTDAIFTAFGGYAVRAPFAAASLLNAYDLAQDPIEVTAIGNIGGALSGVSHPNLVVHRLLSGDSLPDTHPAAAAGSLPEGSVILCRNQTCGAPVQGEREIRNRLMEAGLLVAGGAD